jgi:Ni/Co efflux regulator RcnB
MKRFMTAMMAVGALGLTVGISDAEAQNLNRQLRQQRQTVRQMDRQVDRNFRQLDRHQRQMHRYHQRRFGAPVYAPPAYVVPPQRGMYIGPGGVHFGY